MSLSYSGSTAGSLFGGLSASCFFCHGSSQARRVSYVLFPALVCNLFSSHLKVFVADHGPLWGIEFSLAPAPKPNQSAPKRAKLSGADSRAHLKGLDLSATVTKSIKIRFL